MNAVIGLDIGGTNLRIGLVRDGALERGATFSTHTALAGGDEIALLGALIDDFRGGDQVSAISIGFPSPIAADGKTVLNPPNIIKPDGSHAFKGINVADALSALLGTRVLVNKDANHLLRFDAYTAGLDLAQGTVVGCYIGTGFGSAVMIGGQFVRGKNGSAMEAGHIPFFGGDLLCGCGKMGCAECYASGKAAKAILEAFYPGQSFEEMYRDHAEDAPVASLVEAMAVTVATLANLFDPHALFLGGGAIAGDFPRDRLVEGVLRHAMAPYPREGLDIRFSQQDAFSGVIGAALCA
ncbi:MAG: ROK family protein [Clostridiales bacterium]|nr:ROK family protein [Clostridiales bacterium]